MTNQDQSKTKILIVEDEVVIAADLESRLKGFGYAVCGKATTGEKGLELVEQDQPDLVMMDIVLKGGMGGIEAADVIRDRWGIPVVFLTAYENTDLLKRAKLTYPFGYLLKPFQDRDLKISIEMAHYMSNAYRERGQAEKRNELSRKVLELLNSNRSPTGDINIIKQILYFVKESTGFEAIGIRLKDCDDFPYYETVGFPEVFVAAEKYLCARDHSGTIIRDNIGNPILECMCGNIICGRTDPNLPFFTENGRFWSNCTTELLSSYTEEDRQSRTRNRCNGEGYESVALIPLYSDKEIIGLLQLNDKRRGMFTSEIISFFEGLGASIGIALNRKRAEEALQSSEKCYRRLFEAAYDGILLLDADMGTVIDVNPFLMRLLGYSYEELCGKAIWEIGLFKDVVSSKDAFKTFQYREYIRYEDWLLETRDGRSIEVEFASNVYIVDNRKVIQWNISDITERRQAEAEKKQMQKQLLHSQKMESVGMLAGGIAHDFNNLLQVINGNTQLLLLDKSKNHPDLTNLKEIEKACSMAAQSVRQLLLFSRKAETDRRPMNLNEGFEQARRLLERTIPKMIDIQLHLGRNLWTVLADPVQMEQTLLNLGGNAADAMPDGGRFVIETQNITLDDKYAQNHLGAAPGDYVLLTVSDTGCGMDKETIEHIFDPFFTTKEFGKGTGLGLASVYGIVKGHGGYIMCYSELGQGTTFKIYLPAMKKEVETKSEKKSEHELIGGTETILIVDDDASIRDFTANVLEHFGYEIMTATNGQEALKLYSDKKDEIHLVILDIGMPVMGGQQCLVELLKINPSARVLIASGYSINGTAKKVMDSGAKGFISKPYQLDELITRVRDALDEKE